MYHCKGSMKEEMGTALGQSSDGFTVPVQVGEKDSGVLKESQSLLLNKDLL